MGRGPVGLRWGRRPEVDLGEPFIWIRKRKNPLAKMQSPLLFCASIDLCQRHGGMRGVKGRVCVSVDLSDLQKVLYSTYLT
jgi:hypothetical protein